MNRSLNKTEQAEDTSVKLHDVSDSDNLHPVSGLPLLCREVIFVNFDVYFVWRGK